VNRGRLDPIQQRIASLTPERRALLEQWLMIFQTLEQVARLCVEAGRADRISVLRAAFQATLGDPAFLADA
jgi:hypothetical protein